ncbi:MAG: hypothetical protein ACK6EB_40690, partial [Planctomyces sp.]
GLAIALAPLAPVPWARGGLSGQSGDTPPLTLLFSDFIAAAEIVTRQASVHAVSRDCSGVR